MDVYVERRDSFSHGSCLAQWKTCEDFLNYALAMGSSFLSTHRQETS
jgi:hypothetical protein